MRSPRNVFRVKVPFYDIYSLDILESATGTLRVDAHNIEIEANVKEFNAVNVT